MHTKPWCSRGSEGMSIRNSMWIYIYIWGLYKEYLKGLFHYPPLRTSMPKGYARILEGSAPG